MSVSNGRQIELEESNLTRAARRRVEFNEVCVITVSVQSHAVDAAH